MNVLLVVQPHTPIHLLLFLQWQHLAKAFSLLKPVTQGWVLLKTVRHSCQNKTQVFHLRPRWYAILLNVSQKCSNATVIIFFLSTKQPASFKEVKILHKKLDVQSCKHVQTSWKWAANKHWNGSENLVEWLWLVSVRCQCRSVIGHPEPL